MAGVSDNGEKLREVVRATQERAGFGLLSRFLGAIFLVLVCGLLLLDRALFRASESQSTLDAQTASLLVESFLAIENQTLARVSDIGERGQDTTGVAVKLAALRSEEITSFHAWIRRAADSTAGVLAGGDTLSPVARERLHGLSVPPLGTAVRILPTGTAHNFVALTRRVPSVTGVSDVAGVAFDGDALRRWLLRASADTRTTLLVTSGQDTVVAIGDTDHPGQGMTTAQRVVRLPSGGTWTVTAAHTLATRRLRWALWALGILGAIALAFGLLREQRRSVQANSRSIELERLYSDVKRANQAKSEFLANISHELRTPLNAIVGFVELLREGFYGELVERQILPVDRIAASATHLRHLVDQVLDIAKIAAGRLEVHAEPVVLQQLVLGVANELDSLTNEKSLAFSMTVSAALPRVLTDPAHLRQILINLIGNAVKYTRSGTITAHATIVRYVSAESIAETRRDMGSVVITPPFDQATPGSIWVALEIADSGIGIARANFERIFDEFEQVNAGPRGDSMQRGTGLGLPISRRLARLLGGEITVGSALGQGSTFTVWLPVDPDDLARATSAASGDGPENV